MGLTVATIYLILGVAFFLVGFILLRKLKKYYTEFYENVRCTLWTSAMLLSFSLLIRGVLNLIRFTDSAHIDSDIEDSESEDTSFAAFYDAFMFFFTDMVPICA